MALALHLKAADGDPSWTIVWILVTALAATAGGFALSLLLRHPGRVDYRTNVVPMVKQNCERAEQCQRMADDLLLLKEQVAAERKARLVLAAAVMMAFGVSDRPPPPDLMATLPDRAGLRVVRDA